MIRRILHGVLIVSGLMLCWGGDEAMAACGCPRFQSPVCTSTSAIHRVDHLPYDGTWEGSCCDGGVKTVHVDHVPFLYQGRNYPTLPTDLVAPSGVVHAYVRFDGCR